jgi:hypothetical protein
MSGASWNTIRRSSVPFARITFTGLAWNNSSLVVWFTSAPTFTSCAPTKCHVGNANDSKISSRADTRFCVAK